MEQQHRRFTSKLFLLLAILIIPGCGDYEEINDLANVNMIGVDINDNGKLVAYYQITHPAGIAKEKGTGIKAPVYTYKFEGTGYSQFQYKATETLPRALFASHYQCIIVSGKLARKGVREMLNFLEMEPTRRMAINIYVTEAPLEQVMNTYIPIERLPGKSLRAIHKLQMTQTGRAEEHTRIKDLLRNLESDNVTIISKIDLVHAESTPKTDHYEEINAMKGNFVLKGAVIFKKDRAIGALNSNELPINYLLNGKLQSLIEMLIINGERVEVKVNRKPDITTHLSLNKNTPDFMIKLHTELTLLSNNQNQDLTTENIKQIEQQFNKQITDKAYKLLAKANNEGWDLLGIQERIKHESGAEWNDLKNEQEAWKRTAIRINVKSDLTRIGIANNTYKKE